MGIIKILEKHEVAKIAAGEVVERPAHLVKELVENALDADATSVTLKVEDAGKKLIEVIDDGSGMSQDDAKLCVHPHATSKITQLSDLETINTFGFRGEALASASAVSKLSIKTRLKDADGDGWHVCFEQCEVMDTKPCAMAHGTHVTITDLFYNTPARLKFLKQDETEWNQILATFQAFCLINLKVSFSLYRDGRRIIHAPATDDLRTRVSQVWDHNFAANLLDISSIDHKAPVTIAGLISNRHLWRYRKDQLYIFVNKRWVKNPELSRAIVKGYADALPPGRFPAGVVSLTIDPTQIDINVHPKKEEVRFAKPGTITKTLQHTVTKTLEDEVSKLLDQPAEKSGTVSSFNFDKEVFKVVPATKSGRPEPAPLAPPPAFSSPSSPAPQPIIPKPQRTAPPLFQAQQPIPGHHAIPTIGRSDNYTVVGQFFAMYIMVETKDSMLVIDQHAAHERILYERFRETFEKKEGTRLMFPEVIVLQPHHLKLVLEHKEFFSDQGIRLDQFDDNAISISSSPPCVHNSELGPLVMEVALFIEEHANLDTEHFSKKLNEHMHGEMACKSAIKAGDRLETLQMERLVNDLLAIDNRFKCVHGRPTIWGLTRVELEKKFRRR